MEKLLFEPVYQIKIWLVLFFLLFIFLLSTEFIFAADNNGDYLKNYSGNRLVPVYNVKRDDNKIALTIDGAWGSNKTKDLLELFSEKEIKVSFFFAGIWLENNPDLVEKIINSGHEIYNHSYTHRRFNSLTKTEIKEELLKTEKLIESFYNKPRKFKFFRPPYGEYNNLVISTARELGYQVVQWSLDSHDWMAPGKDYIINRIDNNISSGDILLFHNNAENIVGILNQVIENLKNDYKFVKIEDLIYNNNYQISSFTGLQYEIKDDFNGN